MSTIRCCEYWTVLFSENTLNLLELVFGYDVSSRRKVWHVAKFMRKVISSI